MADRSDSARVYPASRLIPGRFLVARREHLAYGQDVSYAVYFYVVAAYLIFQGFYLGGWAYALFWPALSLLIVGSAYAFNLPGVFGKRSNGVLAPFNWLLLLPYVAAVSFFWNILRLVRRNKPAYHQITEDLIIGRRIFPRELPLEDIDTIVDLTAEHTEPKGVREAKAYVAHPILDNHVPPADELRELVDKIEGMGRLYIHCAEGHGRAALVSACVLLKRGQASSAEEAVGMLKAKRPMVRPRRPQWKALRTYAESLEKPSIG